MDPTRFDQISKIFAARRLSRRSALHRLGAAGLATGLLGTAAQAATAHPAPAAATADPAAKGIFRLYRRAETGAVSVATPAVSEGSKPTTFMFVQSFATGSLVPKPGQEGASGRYTLTLPHGLGETIYFSDRPQRLVGTVPTPAFLKGLGFPENNPPNAVLIGHESPAHQDLVVLELFNPHYDTATNTATYDAQVLQDTHAMDMEFTETPDEEKNVARQYTAAHLFIDDCPDMSVCYRRGPQGPVPGGPVGRCWNWSDFSCHPCNGKPDSYYNDLCNQSYPGCQGRCFAD